MINRELRSKADLLYIYKRLCKKFGFELTYNRGQDHGRGFSMGNYGAELLEFREFKIEKYVHYSGCREEPPSMDIIDTDDPTMELEDALQRVFELQIRSIAENFIADEGMYLHWKDDQRNIKEIQVAIRGE